jgi:hypothetical protein
MICAIIFAYLAGRWRGIGLMFAALIYSGLVLVVDLIALPARFSPGFETILSRPELGAVYCVLALALAAGVRLGADA